LLDPPQSWHTEQSDSIFGQKQHLACDSADVVRCSSDAVEFNVGDGGDGLGDGGGRPGGSGGGGSFGQGGSGGEAGGSKGGLVGRSEQNMYR